MSRDSIGDVGEMEASVYFRNLGWVVSLPWGHAPYDLVVDDGERFFTVEVKRTTQHGWVKKGCKAWGWTIIVDASKRFDYLYCHTPDLHYLIPHHAIGNKRKGLMVPREADVDAMQSKSKWLEYRT